MNVSEDVEQDAPRKTLYCCNYSMALTEWDSLVLMEVVASE